MPHPEIRIYYSWQLNKQFSAALHKMSGSTEPADSEETLREYAQNYRTEWARYGEKIVGGLVDALGVTFYKPILDVPVAPWVRHMSDPLMMSFSFFANQFVDSLTHEMCHVLLTDNSAYSINSSDPEVNLAERWQQLFGEHEFDVLVHIPVHALCKYVYLDILQEPSRLERDMRTVQDDPPYVAAWDYVNSHDYHQIIEQLKHDYHEIAT